MIDVRCLVPLDIAAIESSVGKTGRLLIVEEDHLTGGWGAEVAALIAERAFHHLTRSHPAASPASTRRSRARRRLSRLFVPSVDRIFSTAMEMS